MGTSAKVIILGNNLDHRIIGQRVMDAINEDDREFKKELFKASGCLNSIQYNLKNPSAPIHNPEIIGFKFDSLNLVMSYRGITRKVFFCSIPNHNDYKEFDPDAKESMVFIVGAYVEGNETLIPCIVNAIKDLGSVFYTLNDSVEDCYTKA